MAGSKQNLWVVVVVCFVIAFVDSAGTAWTLVSPEGLDWGPSFLWQDLEGDCGDFPAAVENIYQRKTLHSFLRSQPPETPAGERK